MNSEQVNVVKECIELSMAGMIHFREVLSRLMDIGIERYHADYSRMELTYYSADGSSCVLQMAHKNATIAIPFSAEAVESSVRQAQRGEIMFPQFTTEVLAAGCVGYFVQISGKCVQYFGRNGEIHTENFPDATP